MLNFIAMKAAHFCCFHGRLRLSFVALRINKNFSNLKLDEKSSEIEIDQNQKSSSSATPLKFAEIRSQLVQRLAEQTKKSADGWRPIYRFDIMPAIAFISRIKLYQTFAMVIATPVVGAMHFTGNLDSPLFVYSLAGGSILALIALSIFSIYTRRLVGVISVDNKNENIIRIGHLTFWGTRKNVVCDFTDLSPLTDIEYKKDDMYVALRRYSDPKFKLFLPMKSCTILDHELFEKFFGKSDFHEPSEIN